jgi:hypothetical protein
MGCDDAAPKREVNISIPRQAAGYLTVRETFERLAAPRGRLWGFSNFEPHQRAHFPHFAVLPRGAAGLFVDNVSSRPWRLGGSIVFARCRSETTEPRRREDRKELFFSQMINILSKAKVRCFRPLGRKQKFRNTLQLARSLLQAVFKLD